MTARLREVARGLRWYVRQVTGEAKWDEYVESCRRAGVVPMGRREFERHRDHWREASAGSRCC